MKYRKFIKTILWKHLQRFIPITLLFFIGWKKMMVVMMVVIVVVVREKEMKNGRRTF